VIWLIKGNLMMETSEAKASSTKISEVFAALSELKLSNIVEVTYCDYRTESEYQVQYGAAYWKSLLVELPHAA